MGKALQKSHEDLELRVQERTSQLEAANKELESFTYTVSHDLRAPLRAIDGFSKMLLRDVNNKLDDEEKRKFDVIRESAQRMSRLIDDLLDFSRLGRQEMSFSVFNMSTLVNQSWEECRIINAGRRMELKIGDLPQGLGDSGLIKQVLSNLISNAVKFTRSREKSLIEIGGKIDGQESLYYVKDNGVGFDMKYYDKLFGVFQRLHNDKDYEGTGVGLAIVQQIIHRHGGRVWAEGKVGEGAVFYFTLPSESKKTAMRTDQATG
jgi:light-regulated signal transduction histidine kinase (bacteriophytochrome)